MDGWMDVSVRMYGLALSLARSHSGWRVRANKCRDYALFVALFVKRKALERR